MFSKILAFCMSFFCIMVANAGMTAFPPPPTRALSPPGMEFYGALAVYGGYVGTKPEQIANMIELTIVRVERAKRMIYASVEVDKLLLRKTQNALLMLNAYRHMSHADRLFAEQKKSEGQKELNIACEHAERVRDLMEPSFLSLCKKSMNGQS